MENINDKTEKSVLIAINPPRRIHEGVTDIRRLISQEAGNDVYNGPQNPHITLYINSFYDLERVDGKVKEIARKYKPFYANIEGLHTFNEDPITRSNTIVYKVQKTPEISGLQRKIIDSVKDLRSPSQTEWLLQQNQGYSEANLKNIRKYGFPFGPDDYIFHCSAGSLPTREYQKIEQKLQRFDKKERWQVDSIGIYVKQDNDQFKLHKEYELSAK